MVELHEIIDNVERGLAEQYNCLATIHMDPVVTTSEKVNMLKAECEKIVKSIDEKFTMHDFRIVEGKSHVNVIFDVVLTRESKLSEKQVRSLIADGLAKLDEKYCPVVEFDYPFV